MEKKNKDPSNRIMARCEKEIVTTPKIYVIGHRENTDVLSDNWYGGAPSLGKTD